MPEVTSENRLNQLIQWQNCSWLILTFCPKLKPDAQLVNQF